MKRMWIVLFLCAALLGGCSAGGTAGGGGASMSDAGEESGTVTETVSREPAEESSDVPSNAEYPAQSREEAEERLQALRAEDPHSLYPFLQAVASGEIAPDAHRLDAETAKRILADAAEKHTDGETVYKQLEQEQAIPDHLWGSGMDYRVYWLDGVGDEQLEVCNATTFTYIPSVGEPVVLYNAVDVLSPTRAQVRIEYLRKLERYADKDMALRFPYLEAVASGEAAGWFDRPSWRDVEPLLSSEGDFNGLMQSLEALFPYPDCMWGSGITRIEYWFDADGEDWLEATSTLVEHCWIDDDSVEHREVVWVSP